MNIDLLVTAKGEAGFVCDAMLPSPVAGIIFDAQIRQVTLELANMDTLEMNIPVEDDFAERLVILQSLQMGIIEMGVVQDNRQIPLNVVDEPHLLPDMPRARRQPSNSVLSFEYFMKNAIAGQPLHRDNLGDENSMDGVMSGLSGAALAFAPNLSRQRALEAAPKAAPKMAGPSGPGGMSGGPGGGGYIPSSGSSNYDDE